MSEPCRLGDLVAERVGVFLWCVNCSRSASLDSAALAARLGPSFPVPAVAARCRCSACGSRDVTARPDWNAGLGVISRHTK